MSNYFDHLLLPARSYASGEYAMVVCPSFVTGRCSVVYIETAERIELVFDTEASTSYTVL